MKRRTSGKSGKGDAEAKSHDIGNREGVVSAREGTATTREAAARVREEAVAHREETSKLREEAVRAREEAAQVKAELERLIDQMREINERLVIATVHAQTVAEDAERANRLKDEFLATVSHELRTPLNAVLGWARMLGSQQTSPDRAKRGMGTIERNALAVVHIIDDLLDVSRSVAGTFHLETQPVDLVAVAHAALDLVRPLADAKNVHLSFSAGVPSGRDLRGDPGRLEQVIWNLLANAIKFTPAEGRVEVAVEASGDHMEVRVMDTGQGIGPEFLPQVFERFRQADGVATQRQAGLGLGLAIVRQIVALHGGSVHAASEGEGRGATFTVRLPLSAVPTDSERATLAGEANAAAGSTPLVAPLDHLRILVVDDSADGRSLTSLLLSEAGARVRAVATVREALEVFAEDPPDALVSDIGLPGEDGYALIQYIRQRDAAHGGSVPAVALTGYARPDDRARSLAAGFQAYLSKPVEAEELIATIGVITRHLRAYGT
jgi:signal transduction histidine kinase/ActR/RegA family two-component response regulator